MAPKQNRIQPSRRPAPKSYAATVYSELTSPENATVVRSVAIFGVCCPLSFLLLPLPPPPSISFSLSLS